MTLYQILQENSIFFIIGIMILFFVLLALTIMFIVNRIEWSEENKMNLRNITSVSLERSMVYQQNLLSDLERQVEEKQHQLNQLKAQSLQPELERALDLFDRSNIRISSDIIEDASTRFFQTDEQAVKFIENQRYVWKQENMKKLFKG